MDPSECSAGEVECGGRCVDECSPDEALDEGTCACGPRCGEGFVWDGVQCALDADAGPTCDEPEVACAGACVDLDVDPNHCGDCEQACDPFFACEDGTCTCAGTTEECGLTTCGNILCEDGETPEGCPEDCCDDDGYTCRLVAPQCGCGEAQTCIVDPFEPGRLCVHAGETPDFELCGVLDCRAGSSCSETLVAEEQAETVCRPFCESDDDCAGGGSLCVHPVFDAAGLEVPDARLCTMACDPLTGDGCAPGYDCALYVLEARGVTECLPEGAGVEASPCSEQHDCGRGFVCMALEGGTCHAYCRVGDDCANGDPCHRFADPAVVNGIEYGYCP